MTGCARAGPGTAVLAAVALLAAASPARGMSPGLLRVPGPLGTVDTVAGPGFCPDATALPDSSSAGVGAVAADSSGSGRLWFESGAVEAGLLTTVVSTGAVSVVPTGAGAVADSADLAAASRLAADGAGGVLVAGPTAIFQFGAGRTTVAGTTATAAAPPQQRAGGGDGGSLTAATFGAIAAITTDQRGNVYVADRVDAQSEQIRIRFLNRSAEAVQFYRGTPAAQTVAAGNIETIAGGAVRTEGPGLVAVAPSLAVADGRLYLAAQSSPRSAATVRMLNLGDRPLALHGTAAAPGAWATVTTVPAEVAGARPDGAAATPTSPLPAIAADDDGNLYLAERANHRVRRIDPAGAVFPVAGTGAPGFNGNDRPATEARLDRPYDVDVDPRGRLYISDVGNGQVRVVDSSGTIRAALGNGAGSRWTCSATNTRATAGAARAGQPSALATDASGNIYIATPLLAQIQRLNASGTVMPVVGRLNGCREPVCTLEEGAPGDVDLSNVFDMAIAPGGLYVQDGIAPRRDLGPFRDGASRIRFVNLSGKPLRVLGVDVPAGQVRRVAGDLGGDPDHLNRGRALEAWIRPGAASMAVDRKGTLFVADPSAGVVWHIDSDGGITTSVAAKGTAAEKAGCCQSPSSLLTNPDNNLYISDAAENRVWFLNRGNTVVTVHGVAVAPGAATPIAGAPGSIPRRGILTGSLDEGVPALDAQLGAGALALDTAGNLYITDATAHVVRRVDTAGAITTIAGIGQAAFNGDGLKSALTGLQGPYDLAADRCGNLLIADAVNDRVRRVNLVTRCPRDVAEAARGTRTPMTAAPFALLAVTALAGLLAWRHPRLRELRPSGLRKWRRENDAPAAE